MRGRGFARPKFHSAFKDLRAFVARGRPGSVGQGAPASHIRIVARFEANFQRNALFTPYANNFIELQALRLSIFSEGGEKTVPFSATIT